MTKHTADYRPIEHDDIASCTRGLQLAKRTPTELRALIATHAKVDMFASAVIVIAAAGALNLPEFGDLLDLAEFPDVELQAMLRTPDERFRTLVSTQIEWRVALRELEQKHKSEAEMQRKSDD